MSTICRYSSRVVAFLQAVARPKFREPRSASIARSQVWLGLPTGRFHTGGTCQIHTAPLANANQLPFTRLKSAAGHESDSCNDVIANVQTFTFLPFTCLWVQFYGLGF